jgi:FtsZ-binding cell division protein ZapB
MGQAKLNAKFKENILYHEAGHALLARLHGIEIVEIKLTQKPGNYHGRVLTRSGAHAVTERVSLLKALANEAKGALGGPIVGIDEMRGAKYADGEGRAGDYKTVARCVRHMAVLDRYLASGVEMDSIELLEAEIAEAKQIAERLRQEAEDEVRDNWDAVERIAELFKSGGVVTQADVDACIPRSSA